MEKSPEKKGVIPLTGEKKDGRVKANMRLRRGTVAFDHSRREGTDGASPRAVLGEGASEPRGGNAPPVIPVTGSECTPAGVNSGGTTDSLFCSP